MAVNFSLVLNFVSSIGVQVQSNFGAPINSTLMTLVLFVAAFTVFPITLFSLVAALRQQPFPSAEEALLSSTSAACSIAPINGEEQVDT